jgi:hydrogenase expression/formation protein HypC
MCLAVPGRILNTFIDAQDVRMGKVDFGGVCRAVCLEHVPLAEVGDWVLVHVGFALTRLDHEEALRVLDLLRELGTVLDDEIGPS